MANSIPTLPFLSGKTAPSGPLLGVMIWCCWDLMEILPKDSGLTYEEMDKLRPCARCGSRRYWFEGDMWQCWHCVPPPSPDQIRVDLTKKVN